MKYEVVMGCLQQNVTLPPELQVAFGGNKNSVAGKKSDV